MDMIEVSTIDYLPGYRITKSLGIVFSSKIMNQAIASDNTNIEEMLDTARQDGRNSCSSFSKTCFSNH